MDTPSLNPLTPAQIAALEAGDGFMVGHDPATNRDYVLIDQVEATIDDEYIRTKLAEAQASIDRGEVAEWDVDALKSELRLRLGQQSSQQS
jgi:hypothetical protein